MTSLSFTGKHSTAVSPPHHSSPFSQDGRWLQGDGGSDGDPQPELGQMAGGRGGGGAGAWEPNVQARLLPLTQMGCLPPCCFETNARRLSRGEKNPKYGCKSNRPLLVEQLMLHFSGGLRT